MQNEEPKADAETPAGAKSGEEDPSDPAAIARRFADLWQAQLAALAADPEMARTVADSARIWQRFAGAAAYPPSGGGEYGTESRPGDPLQAAAMDMGTAMSRAASEWGRVIARMGATPAEQEEASGNARQDDSPRDGAGAPDPPRTAAAGAAPDDGIRLLRELDRRMERLERRLNELESGAGSAGGSPEGNHQRPRSKRGGKRDSGKP
jgi:hypothetical protein